MFNNSNTYNDDYQEDGYQSDDNSYDNDNDNDEMIMIMIMIMTRNL
jgi:hypothetical protein